MAGRLAKGSRRARLPRPIMLVTNAHNQNTHRKQFQSKSALTSIELRPADCQFFKFVFIVIASHVGPHNGLNVLGFDGRPVGQYPGPLFRDDNVVLYSHTKPPKCTKAVFIRYVETRLQA